tara:strand:- start:110058 stop:110246 length:189 start_codon:yes stop_codon:yes gene_type:complete
MARAKPSQAAVKNVIEALKACGMSTGAVRVGADGSFSVEAKESGDRIAAAMQNAPRKFGQAR